MIKYLSDAIIFKSDFRQFFFQMRIWSKQINFVKQMAQILMKCLFIFKEKVKTEKIVEP